MEEINPHAWKKSTHASETVGGLTYCAPARRRARVGRLRAGRGLALAAAPRPLEGVAHRLVGVDATAGVAADRGVRVDVAVDLGIVAEVAVVQRGVAAVDNLPARCSLESVGRRVED